MTATRRGFTAGMAGLAASAVAPRMAQAAPSDKAPNVIIVRFGGGVRRRETIAAKTTFAPNLLHRLAPRGVLIPDMRIAQLEGVDTSHAEGTPQHPHRPLSRLSPRRGRLGRRSATAHRADPVRIRPPRARHPGPSSASHQWRGSAAGGVSFPTASTNPTASPFAARCSVCTASSSGICAAASRRSWREARRPMRRARRPSPSWRNWEEQDYRADKAGQGKEIETLWRKWRAFYGGFWG